MKIIIVNVLDTSFEYKRKSMMEISVIISSVNTTLRVLLRMFILSSVMKTLIYGSGLDESGEAHRGILDEVRPRASCTSASEFKT